MWNHDNVAMIMSTAVKPAPAESFIAKTPTYVKCQIVKVQIYVLRRQPLLFCIISYE